MVDKRCKVPEGCVDTVAVVKILVQASSVCLFHQSKYVASSD